MELLTDLFYAVVLAGAPLMALSFAMIWWAMHRGRLKGESVGELQKSIQALGASRKKSKKGDGDEDDQEDSTEDEPHEKLDPVLDKWFAFGGGFYGLVALYTWIIVEWNEVWNFAAGVFRFIIELNLDIGALITLAINLLIESIMNFITAIAWPWYWLGVAGNPWIWIGVAYGGYWLGIRLAQRVTGMTWGEDNGEFASTIARQEDDDAV